MSSLLHRSTATSALIALSVLLAPGLASDALADPTAAPVVVHLNAMNGSSESGIVTLTPKGPQTIVEVKLTGAPDGPQPAHFHTGTCTNYAPRPLYPLDAIKKGISVTTLDVPIDKLTAGDLVINVHHSVDDIATISSCGVSKA
jgi:hypothetical protein